jgi:hypothetical protein
VREIVGVGICRVRIYDSAVLAVRNCRLRFCLVTHPDRLWGPPSLLFNG